MKHIYLFLITMVCSLNPLRAQYYWQITEITSISNGGTYDVDSIPENIQLSVNQCPGGIDRPNFSTSYFINWYANTIDTNSGGTLISSFLQFTTYSFTSTIEYTPPTDVAGTFYYYAVINDPSSDICGFKKSDSLVSPTVKVTVNSSVLSINERVNQQTGLYPNPTKDFITITNLASSTKYSLYNYLGTEISSGSTSSNEQINIMDLRNGLYFIKLENGKVLEFIKD